jgi:integrase
MARLIHRLTERSLRALIDRARKNGKRGTHRDGGSGLIFNTYPSGSANWTVDYRNGPKRHNVGLGGFPRVTLKIARERADALKRQLKLDGVDPLASRAEQKARRIACPTFAAAAQRYIEAHKAGWKSPKHSAQWGATLSTYAYPKFGDLPVNAVETAHVLAAIEPIWSTKPETASRLRGRIESILDYANAHKWRHGENPAAWRGHLSLTLPARSKVRKVEHHAALPWRETAAFMSALRSQAGVGPLALQFAILTAARSGEVRGMTWGEVDFDHAVWIVPAARMKAHREHRVPLTEPAIAILRQMVSGRAPGELVFPGQRPGRPLSDMSLTAVLKRMRRGGLTAHGFRSTFRDWAAETTAYSNELLEMALAHAVSSKVEAAYRRGDMFDRRRRLMSDWSSFAMGETSTKVIQLHA